MFMNDKNARCRVAELKLQCCEKTLWGKALVHLLLLAEQDFSAEVM